MDPKADHRSDHIGHALYLVDLTYTQQGLQSEIMPNAIGCLATYAKKTLDDAYVIRLFKRPERLIEALEAGFPRAIGFSTYTWNYAISYAFAETIKAACPETVVVFGGPNYSNDPGEQEDFLRAHPAVDFFVVKEGEIPFARLLARLAETGFDLNADYDIAAVHYLNKHLDRAVLPPANDRIRDLSEIPSPYVAGLMDPYFEDGFMPILQTKRGCPFTCTFCVEGDDYYSKINRNAADKVSSELRYIGAKMAPLVAQGKRADLFIADSNFAMFAEDLETCRAIRDCQDDFDWPRFISVATGKNRKERVIEAAEIMRGALLLSGSVQSLDVGVLANIRRKNVSADQVLDIATHGGKLGASTVSEIILGLPGDSRESFEDTLAQLLEMGFNRLSIYTLMLLPGAELDTKETREKFGFATKFRVIPKCFGHYEFQGSTISAGEIEEVVVATNTLPFADYVECRILSLLVEIFFNEGIFELTHRLLKSLGVVGIDFLRRLRGLAFGERLAEIVDGFIGETNAELWDSREDLAWFLRDPENVARFISGEMGNNVIYKHKSLAFVQALDDLGRAIKVAAEGCIADRLGALNHTQSRFISEIVDYGAASGRNLFADLDGQVRCRLHFDPEEVIEGGKFAEIGRSVFADSVMEYAFVHDADQLKAIGRLIGTYGTDVSGLQRLVTRTNLKSLLRRPVVQGESGSASS